MKQNKNVSTGFYHLVVQIFALMAFTFVLMLMKKDPNIPLKIPNTTAPTKTSVGVTSSTLTFPNLRDDAVQEENLPLAAASKIAKQKTAIEHDKKVFQRMENFQNGWFDNSNMNRAPPIGAPNATLTPAEAPAAMSYLFLWSLCKNLKYWSSLGK